MMKKTRPNTVLMVLMSLVLVSLVALNILHFGDGWSLNQREWWRDAYDLLNAIFINLLAAYFFYLLIAGLFVNRRRKIIKANLQKQYRQFRESVISTFLDATNRGHNSKDVESLCCDFTAFREYFYPEAAVKNRENVKWYDVINRVQESEYLQHELIIELSVLRDEVEFVLSSIEIHDEKIFEFFKRLQRIIYRHEHGQFETDDFKSFMQFFFEMFAGWDFVTGDWEKDIVQSFIDSL